MCGLVYVRVCPLARGKRFPENPPARATFAVKTLPLNALVEIDCTAYLD